MLDQDRDKNNSQDAAGDISHGETLLRFSSSALYGTSHFKLHHKTRGTFGCVLVPTDVHMGRPKTKTMNFYRFI